jgi:hypothetical protein
MSGKVKIPPIPQGLGLPNLSVRPDGLDIVDGGDCDPSAIPSEHMLYTSGVPAQRMEIPPLPDYLRLTPDKLLQQSLGELRWRIVNDPEGEDGCEAMDRYCFMIDGTTLPNILLTEGRIWKKLMESENPALAGVARRSYYRLVQHGSYTMSKMEAVWNCNYLLERIGRGDLDSSREALITYQGFVERFLSCRRDLMELEVPGFRVEAQMRIDRVLAGEVDEGAISHLEDLLAVYAKIIFYDGINVEEIEEGTRWVETYLRGGHPLEQCARETLDSLNMMKDSIERKQAPAKPGDPSTNKNAGNGKFSEAGEIDTKKYRAGKAGVPLPDVPTLGARTVFWSDPFTTTKGSK